MRYFFRPKVGEESIMRERLGTAVYSDKQVEELRQEVLAMARACLVIAGGDRTKLEASECLAAGVPVIPLAASGGEARILWDGLDVRSAGLPDDQQSRDDWALLAVNEPSRAIAAAIRLIRRAMFLPAV